jgi:hypothetical protein
MIYDTATKSVQSVVIIQPTRDRARRLSVSGGVSIYTEKIQSCTRAGWEKSTASVEGAMATVICIGVPSVVRT